MFSAVLLFSAVPLLLSAASNSKGVRAMPSTSFERRISVITSVLCSEIGVSFTFSVFCWMLEESVGWASVWGGVTIFVCEDWDSTCWGGVTVVVVSAGGGATVVVSVGDGSLLGLGSSAFSFFSFFLSFFCPKLILSMSFPTVDFTSLVYLKDQILLIKQK